MTGTGSLRRVLILMIIVLGLAAGWVAHLIVAPRRPIDWGRALIAGLAGSFVGGLLVSLVAGDGLDLRPSGLIGSIVGAIIVVAIWQAIDSRGIAAGKPRGTAGTKSRGTGSRKPRGRR